MNKRRLTSTLPYQVDQAGYGPVGSFGRISRTYTYGPYSFRAQAGAASESELPVLPNEALTEAVVLLFLHQHEPLLFVDVPGGI